MNEWINKWKPSCSALSFHLFKNHLMVSITILNCRIFKTANISKKFSSTYSQPITYSYGYEPIGVPHFGQVHVSWYPMKILIKIAPVSSKTNENTDQDTWILISNLNYPAINYSLTYFEKLFTTWKLQFWKVPSWKLGFSYFNKALDRCPVRSRISFSSTPALKRDEAYVTRRQCAVFRFTPAASHKSGNTLFRVNTDWNFFKTKFGLRCLVVKCITILCKDFH